MKHAPIPLSVFVVLCSGAATYFYWNKNGAASHKGLLVIGIIAGAFGLASLVASVIARCIKSNQAEDSPGMVLFRETILVVLVLALGCIGIISFVTFLPGSFDVNSFDQAHIEWLITVGWGIAIVGAIWAMLAKVKADMAFGQAERAAETSQQAYLAVTTKSLAFDDLMLGGRLREHIQKASDELFLLLGSPFVGYFKQDPAGRFVTAATDVALAIEDRFAKVKKARVVFFNWKLCEELANDAIKAGAKMDKAILHGLYDGFGSFLKTQPVSNDQDLPPQFAVSYEMYGAASQVGPLPAGNAAATEIGRKRFDPGIRIAISKNTDLGYRHAYVWFVEGFVEEKPTEFNSVAFETKDPTLIKLLESLVEEYAIKLNNMLAADGNSVV